MSTVAIVGAGHVAGATAHALAMSDRIGRLLLVDDAASAARGKALDIRQSGAISHAPLVAGPACRGSHAARGTASATVARTVA